MRRIAAVVTALFAFAFALGGVAVGAPALADPIGQCAASTGTIVAVDFSHWSGPFVRGCGVHSATGYQLLHDAGFTTADDQHDGPGFICRIGDPAFDHGTQYPTPKDEQCVLTPPASASWSYWLAPKGQNTWTYTRLGVMSDRPKPGEVELWQFGATNVSGTEGGPSVTPNQLRAHNTSPVGGRAAASHSSSASHTAHRPVRPATSASTASDRGTPTHAVQPAAGAHITAHADPTAATSSTSARASATSTKSRSAEGGSSPPPATSSGSGVAGSSDPAVASQSGSAGPHIVDAQPASADTKKPSTGSALPVVVGLCIALLLGGGAGVTVLRRRRAESSDS
jgi:hypothetical protein